MDLATDAMYESKLGLLGNGGSHALLFLKGLGCELVESLKW